MLGLISDFKIMLATLFAKYLPLKFLNVLPETVRDYALTLKVEYGYEEYYKYVIYPSIIVALELDKYINIPISVNDIIVNERLPESARHHLKWILKRMEKAGLVKQARNKFILKNKLEIRYTENAKLSEKYEGLSPSSWQPFVNSLKEIIYSKKATEMRKITFSNALQAKQVKSLISILGFTYCRDVIYFGCSPKVLDVILSTCKKLRKIKVYCKTLKPEKILKAMHGLSNQRVTIEISNEVNMENEREKGDLIVVTDDFRGFYDNFEFLIEDTLNLMKEGGLALVIGLFAEEEKDEIFSLSEIHDFEPTIPTSKVNLLLNGRIKKHKYFFKKKFLDAYMALTYIK
ncbi:MAG: hypothetical protein ACP6IS_04155 [Candidatus Asgardarchaeia archaeon]